ADPLSKSIYNNWLSVNQNTQKITGSVTADKRQALVDFFRNEAQIMIATEAAAEGINLQFCSLLINYDLPWNPQRVEQRIGRCHRYGQKNDVVVINFLNKANAADVRVYELLDNKFKLFSGVFGSSDEVLGAIESGVDFEKKMLEIYQRCRTEEEINEAFDNLRAELEDIIEENLTQTRTSLLENFDQEVIEKLKVREKHDADRLDKYQHQLWSLTKECLREYITLLDDQSHTFNLNKTPVGINSSLGKYCLSRNQGDYYNYRISHPLAAWAIENAKTLSTEKKQLVINYSDYPYKISLFDQYRGKKGYLFAKLISFEALTDTEEHIILVAMDERFQLLDDDFASKILTIPIAEENVIEVSTAIQDRLYKAYSQKKDELIEELELRNNDIMTEEISKIEKWAEDNRKQHQHLLNKIDEEIEEKNKLFVQEKTMKRKLQIQKEKQQLDEKREVAWREYDLKKREISEHKNRLIERLTDLADAIVDDSEGFVIEWIVK
ncbi:MAG: helicase-related protein, partial [Bacteroidales bacterium]